MFFIKTKRRKHTKKTHQNARIFFYYKSPLWFSNIRINNTFTAVIKHMLLKSVEYNFEAKVFILFSSFN